MTVSIQDSIFLKALRGEPTERTPVWLMRQAGRYQKTYRDIRAKVDFLTLCHTSELACQVTVDAVEQLGVDAGIIFADILLPLEAMDAGLTFAKGDGPSLARPVSSASDVDVLHNFDVSEKLGYVFESIKLFIRAKPDVPLIGFAGAPFTLASYLIEGGSSRNFEKTKKFMYLEPLAFERLMSLLSDVTIDYLRGQQNAGAHCLMLFDSWVGILGRDDYTRYVQPHTSRIFKSLNLPDSTIYFGTGCGTMLDLMSSCGSTAMGVDWRSDIKDARKLIGVNKPVMGNLDPLVLFADRDTITERTQDVLRRMQGERGHIFNLGHGILQHTPEDNVKHLVECVQTWTPGV